MTEYTGERGLSFLKAWHPETAASGVFCFDCIKCARTFENWDKCFDSKHLCIKTASLEPLTSAPPLNSDRRHSSYVSVFPVHVEKKNSNDIKYKRFWTQEDVKTYESFDRRPARL